MFLHETNFIYKQFRLYAYIPTEEHMRFKPLVCEKL